MKPGLYVESVPSDIGGSAALAVCDAMHHRFADDPLLADGICLAITPTSPRHIWISLLKARWRRQGLGAAAMDALCRACDANGVTLEMEAVSLADRPGGENGLDQASLEQFYRRRGFRVAPAITRKSAMCREPATA